MHKKCPDKRAGGAELVSPALQRGEKGFHKFVTESRRDGARTLFMQESIALKGTGFSPYVKSSNETAGFSP